MSSAAHTSLPWEVEGLSVFCSKATRQWDGSVACAKHHPNMPWEEAEANAAFIVRACNSHYELLNAAKEIMQVLQQYGSSVVPHLLDTDDNAGQRLREALAKAEAQ